MRTIREALRLRWQCGLSTRDIAISCRVSATAVRGYIHRAEQSGLSWPLPEHLQDAELDRLLYPPPQSIPSHWRALPDWKQVRHELKRKGVTLQLLWEEHRRDHPDSYGYSRFCELYAAWERTAEPRMIQEHKAGDKLFVDYAGLRVPLTDPKTGQVTQAEIFVGSLGASSYIFAEATPSQTLPDWIGSHVRCFQFLGGVPRIVVPDNLKSGVTSPCRYEPDVNPTSLKLACHYGVAVVPARVRKPRDKPKVENAVQQVERRILARIRDHTFHSIEEINAAIEPLLTELNERSTRSLGTSRKQLFDTIDRPALAALPEHPFGEGEWSKARVSIDYHVVVDGHRYSVPFTFIGSVVEIRLAQHTVEMFLDGARLASHLRSRVRNSFTTHKEHMPPNHQQVQWQETRFLAQAKKHGPKTERFAMRLLDTRPVREQAFRSCMGILRLGDKYGSTRLEAACERALITEAISYKSVDAILKSGLDRHPVSNGEPALPPILHGNIRGADYYGSIGVNGVSSTKPFGPHGTQQTREVEHA